MGTRHPFTSWRPEAGTWSVGFPSSWGWQVGAQGWPCAQLALPEPRLAAQWRHQARVHPGNSLIRGQATPRRQCHACLRVTSKCRPRGGDVFVV